MQSFRHGNNVLENNQKKKPDALPRRPRRCQSPVKERDDDSVTVATAFTDNDSESFKDHSSSSFTPTKPLPHCRSRRRASVGLFGEMTRTTSSNDIHPDDPAAPERRNPPLANDSFKIFTDEPGLDTFIPRNDECSPAACLDFFPLKKNKGVGKFGRSSRQRRASVTGAYSGRADELSNSSSNIPTPAPVADRWASASTSPTKMPDRGPTTAAGAAAGRPPQRPGKPTSPIADPGPALADQIRNSVYGYEDIGPQKDYSVGDKSPNPTTCSSSEGMKTKASRRGSAYGRLEQQGAEEPQPQQPQQRTKTRTNSNRLKMQASPRRRRARRSSLCDLPSILQMDDLSATPSPVPATGASPIIVKTPSLTSKSPASAKGKKKKSLGDLETKSPALSSSLKDNEMVKRTPPSRCDTSSTVGLQIAIPW